MLSLPNISKHKSINIFSGLWSFTSINVKQLINDTFHKNNYSNIQLLNDFNHIKYYHHANENNLVFASVFEYFTNDFDILCNPHNCKNVQRYHIV